MVERIELVELTNGRMGWMGIDVLNGGKFVFIA